MVLQCVYVHGEKGRNFLLKIEKKIPELQEDFSLTALNGEILEFLLNS